MSFQVSLQSAVVLSAMAIASSTLPAQAMSITGFGSPWTSSGYVAPDPSTNPSAVALFTGASGGTPTDASAGAFQSFLDVSSSSLDLNALEQAFEGSALKIVVNAGDQLDFNWAFLPASFTELDYAFSVFNGAVTNLANTFATGSFSQTFASSGLFSIGLVDIGDTEGDSILTLNGASYTPVPTPALLPGLICLGLSVVRKRKQQSA